MRSLARTALCIVVVACTSLSARTPFAQPARAESQLGGSPLAASRVERIRAHRLFDGERLIESPRDVVLEAGRIAAIVPVDPDSPPSIELAPDATLLPGLIDTHVHIGWHFDAASGKTHSADVEESEAEEVLYAAENAYQTLMGGFTTVQSLGSPIDLPLRDAIERGVLIGPRILTSRQSLSARVGDAESMRIFVREQSEAGADAIKIFASASIRDGGTPTLNQEQLDAACSEARRLGLRTLVHAHGPESARRAVVAGCTTIEHGALLDRETLELMAERSVYFDPNCDLVFRNYFENKERFLGVGNYTEEGFRQMESAVSSVLEVFRTGLTIPGLNMVFGTDAVAGSHGRNVEELLYRVDVGGQAAANALVSATSLAATSLGVGDEIGSIRAGYVADLIAVEGDPTRDIDALRDITLIIIGGRRVR